MRCLLWLLAWAVVVPAGTLSAHAAVPPNDFGDAPDGRAAGYLGVGGAVGHFPSLEGSNGARHRSVGPLRLGRRVSSEQDSRQVDRDRFDDGFSAELRRCKTSKLRFLVDARSLPSATRTADHTAYLNAWFDWNRDGDWADTDACAPEWRLQNFPIDMASFASRPRQLIEINVVGGAQVAELWYRASLTLDEPFVSGIGAGAFINGETEDYLDRRVRRGLRVKCSPNTAVTTHDRRAKVKFLYKGPAPAVQLTNALPKGVKVALTAKGFTLRATRDRPVRLQNIRLRFRFRRGGRLRIVTCYVLVLHTKITKPKTPKRPQPPPPKPCPNGFAMVLPANRMAVQVQAGGCDRDIDRVVIETELRMLELVGVRQVQNATPGDPRQWSCAVRARFGGRPNVECVASQPYPPNSFFNLLVELDISPPPSPGEQLMAQTNLGAMPNGAFAIAVQ